MKNNKITLEFTEEASTISGKEYCGYYQINGVNLFVDQVGKIDAFISDSTSKKRTSYTINKEKLKDVIIHPSLDFLIFETENNIYFRNFENQKLENSEHWVDYYLEPITNSFYRKNNHDHWFDMEGFRIWAPILIKGDILISLNGKCSKKSISYRDQQPYISQHHQLIQVGKIVYNYQLVPVQYFGEKITSLGSKNIKFKDQDVLQEVYIGLNRTVFINEYTQKPYRLNDEEITKHLQTLKIGNKSFEVFFSEYTRYFVENDSLDYIKHNNSPLELDQYSLRKINNLTLVHAHIVLPYQSFYVELDSFQVYHINQDDKEKIIEIKEQSISVNGEEWYNMKTENEAFVFNTSTQEKVSLTNEDIDQFQFESINELDNLVFIHFGDKKRLFSLLSMKIVKLGSHATQISTIIKDQTTKLINAISANGNKIVLDVRHSINEPKIAYSNTQKILYTEGKTYKLGNKMVQKVKLETLGGQETRIIDLNCPDLSIITLPSDLSIYTEQAGKSIFASNPIIDIDFANTIEVDDMIFYQSTFLSYTQQEFPLILQAKNGMPIHIPGQAHKNELVSQFLQHTLEKEYYINKHRMVSCKSLSEDMRANKLVFSLLIDTSWIEFYDAYLPIMKDIVDIEQTSVWDYYLIELREVANDIEYIAIEKNRPNRVLVEKVKGKHTPLVIKSKRSTSLKSPTEISTLRRFFMEDPGYLVELS